MSNKPQLGWGAGELKERLKADIRDAYITADETDPNDPLAVRDAFLSIKESLHRADVRIDGELTQMLQRRSPGEPTQDARIRALERKTDDMAGMLSSIMQMLGQTL